MIFTSVLDLFAGGTENNKKTLEERIGGMTGLSQNLAGDSTMQNRMREAYIIEQLRMRKSEYSIEENVSVYLVTYNAGGKKPKAGAEIPPNFFTGRSSTNDQSADNLLNLPDLYVFCIQEVCPLNPKSVITKSENAKVWEDHLAKTLNEFSTKRPSAAAEYVRIISKDMMGLFTVVFLRKDKLDIYNAAESATAEVAVGVFGIVVSFVKEGDQYLDGKKYSR